jgi:hypothetical protein
VEAGVPDKPGVYLLGALSGKAEHLVYVGRAGTLQTDGTFKDQMLLGRLQAKQEGLARQEFFRRRLREGAYDGLRIQWLVTWEQRVRVAPAFAEAELLQAYLLEHCRLPPWNKSF